MSSNSLKAAQLGRERWSGVANTKGNQPQKQTWELSSYLSGPRHFLLTFHPAFLGQVKWFMTRYSRLGFIPWIIFRPGLKRVKIRSISKGKFIEFPPNCTQRCHCINFFSSKSKMNCHASHELSSSHLFFHSLFSLSFPLSKNINCRRAVYP